jgi:hypothetical protein
MVRYQSMLGKTPQVLLEVVKTLNPATLVWVNSGPQEHDSVEVMDEVFSSLPGFTIQPIICPDIEYFTGGNSFV